MSKLAKATRLARRIKALEAKAYKLSSVINSMLAKDEITKAQYNSLAD